tara:strand:- start:18 stop:449 length:432 start_codon:yes stop_codon:yes gene_type:complete
MYNYIYLSILAALFWAIGINIEKQYLLKTFKPLELILFRSILYVLFVSFYFYYSNSICLNYDKIDMKICMIMVLSITLGFISLYIFLSLLNNKKISNTLTFIHPLIIVFGVLISYLIYNEKINLKEILGIMLVLSGIFMINYK